jgi:hypothetical protein
MDESFDLAPKCFDIDVGRRDSQDDREQLHAGCPFHGTPWARGVIPMPMGRVCTTWLEGLLKSFEPLDPVTRERPPARDHLSSKSTLEHEPNFVADDG